MRRSDKKRVKRGFPVETPFQAELARAKPGTAPHECKLMLDAVEEFFKWAQAALLPLGDPNRRVPMVIGAMFGTATRRLPFILSAGRVGAMPEVAILLRASLELEASAAYIFFGRDSEALAKRFLAFELVLHRRTLELISVDAPEKITPEVRARMEHLNAQILDQTKEFPGLDGKPSQPWSGKGHWKMFEEATELGMDGAHFRMFRSHYKVLCSLAHPTPMGIRGVGDYGLLGMFLRTAIFSTDQLYRLACRASGVEPAVPRRLYEGWADGNPANPNG